jgi:hypothetical protein
LFLSAAFLTFTVRFLARAHLYDAAIASCAGVLAFAVKPPTVMTFVALAGLWWFARLRQFATDRPRPSSWERH